MNAEMEALVVQRGHRIANDLVREFAYRFPHQIVGFRQFGAGKVACDLRSRLRREVKQLRLERDILSKAAAWFARETDVIPPKGSDS